MAIQQILTGLLLSAIGVVSLKYNFQIVGLTGRQDWIESRLGAGSTYSAYKLLSTVLVISGVLYMSGLGQPLLRYLLSPITNVFNFPN